MTKFALQYVYEDQFAARRSELLEAHRGWLRDIEKDGNLITAGAFSNGTGAILAFEYDTLEEAMAAADRDPFIVAGLVSDRSINPWNVTWGSLA